MWEKKRKRRKHDTSCFWLTTFQCFLCSTQKLSSWESQLFWNKHDFIVTWVILLHDFIMLNDDGLLLSIWAWRNKQYTLCEAMLLSNFLFVPFTIAELTITEVWSRQRGSDVLLILSALLEVLYQQLKWRWWITSSFLTNQAKERAKTGRNALAFFIYLFFLDSHCTYFEKCQRALLGLVPIGTTWFPVPLSNLSRCYYQEENIQVIKKTKIKSPFYILNM